MYNSNTRRSPPSANVLAVTLMTSARLRRGLVSASAPIVLGAVYG